VVILNTVPKNLLTKSERHVNTYCKNARCRHCFIDNEDDEQRICTANPQLITIPSSRVFVLKCNTYLKRDPGDHLKPICTVGRDGLFPGQLPYPIDVSDVVAEDTVVGLDSLKDCKT
jgi:polygalacturonase